MKIKLSLALAILLSAFIVPQSGATTLVPNNPHQTITFTGICADCTNPHGVLTLQNYTYGTQITQNNFFSFTYSSSIFSGADAINWNNTTYRTTNQIYGMIGSTPGFYYVQINHNDFLNGFTAFNTNGDTTGTWCVGSGNGTGPAGDCTINNEDNGTAGTLTPVTATPEPASLWLLGSGVPMIVAARRRFLRS
jgi:hypothetical protein